ncbi:hypothetical protein LPY66_14150 [Dehalobacter sp. DCM]|uniref:hypothetical protein n=1 Tax=Dehalobacter sp. DCM TaxID=2907827 RepID=UPI003081894D|nr:hypothetical protein LPY66_14150 [Dehalobacter sp. DCM]
MKKINDSQTLGIVSGLVGGLSMVIFDQISYKMGISKRSYGQAASGIWVASKKQSDSRGGDILGLVMSLGLATLGGVVMTRQLQKAGTDKLVTKGLFYGTTYGGFVTAMMSGFPKNKIKPKDATSNLSYVGSHMLYGLITTQLIARLGDQSLFRQKETQSVNAYENVSLNNQVTMNQENIYGANTNPTHIFH